MISKNEIKSFLSKEPYFEDIMCSLQSGPKMPKAIVKETQQLLAYVRKFKEEYIKPNSLAIDQKCQENHDMLPLDIMDEVNKWGFYTMWLPKAVGGRGYNMLGVGLCFEELSSECLGITNVIGVHYLGVMTLAMSLNIRLMTRILGDVVRGEKEGKPCLLSLAITEPEAGTDVEEVALVDKGRITCRAEKVDGGYIVNGRKIFISMGHVSTWHMLIAYEDLKHPSETMLMLAVKTGMKGFSFGRQEMKMGQKACPASELIFEDCFVPDDLVCCDTTMIKGFSKPIKIINEMLIDIVTGASRAGVGAMGIGVARGALEDSVKFASKTEINGKLLINHEWAQCMLAEMYKNVNVGRAAYMESIYVNGLYSLMKSLQFKPLYYYLKYMPTFLLRLFVYPFMNVSFIANFLSNRIRKLLYNTDFFKHDEMQRVSGWGSLAKFVGTDIGIKNCHMAIELMGQAGIRHDMQVEKRLRDSKLLQIYEGTNQLNRLNLFKCLVGREIPSVKIFED